MEAQASGTLDITVRYCLGRCKGEIDVNLHQIHEILQLLDKVIKYLITIGARVPFPAMLKILATRFG